VFLQWPTAKALFTALYRIERRAKGAQGWKEIARIPASTDDGVYCDAAAPGQWDYRLTPVNAAGVDGPPTIEDVAYKPAASVAPALDLPLTAQPEGCRVNGGVTFGPEGAQFKNGTIAFPHQPWMDLGAGMTLDFEFKLDHTGEMPVLICHGVWQGDGWFVQVLGNALIVRTPTGDAKGPTIEAGKWYKVRFAFDGIRVHLAIDGKWLDQVPQVIRPVSNPRNLVLGNYDMNSSSYIFGGTLRNVKLYNDVLVKFE